MKAHRRITLSVFVSMLFLVGMLLVVVSPVMAMGKLLWEGEVPSSGVEVVSSVSEPGKYFIVVQEIWWYDNPGNLAADAQYYTTNNSDHWNWGNHFLAPGGHSFLQINGEDVYWGSFSNGDAGHTYSIYYNWAGGGAISFRIVDWIDDNYDNNSCHILVRIYGESVSVGGYVVDSNPSRIGASRIIIALIVALVVTIPIMKCFRNSHYRIG